MKYEPRTMQRATQLIRAIINRRITVRNNPNITEHERFICLELLEADFYRATRLERELDLTNYRPHYEL